MSLTSHQDRQLNDYLDSQHQPEPKYEYFRDANGYPHSFKTGRIVPESEVDGYAFRKEWLWSDRLGREVLTQVAG